MIEIASDRGDPANGFTLLEVLVALVILAISLGTLLDIFSSTIRRQTVVGDERTAVLLAQSKLEGLGSELALVDGPVEGKFDNGFGWRLQIEPVPNGTTQSALVAKLATLTVLWPRANGPRSLIVKTIRLVERD